MQDLDARTLGARVAEARERANLTQVELAKAVSLDRSALAKIETGTRRITALELARIADVVDERIEWFIDPAPAAIVSHRNLSEPGAASPAIDRWIERIVRNVEFVMRHDNQLRLRATPSFPRPSSAQEMEQRAQQARRLFGLDEKVPFVDIVTHLTEVGLLAFTFDLGHDTADAASVLLDQAGGVAVVNGALHVGRRRLALAHELGHYLFADEYTIDWKIDQDEPHTWEAHLDRFARAVLLPASGAELVWQKLRSTPEELRTAAVRMASQYRVDMATLARRLLELKHISPSEADQIRTFRTTRADIVEYNLVTSPELQSPTLARAYEQAVLRLYNEETVSPARATDLMFDTWDEGELPPLPELPEQAIWTFVS